MSQNEEESKKEVFETVNAENKPNQNNEQDTIDKDEKQKQNIEKEENLTSEELLAKGKSLMKETNYEEATSVLSQALQTIVEKYVDDEKSINLLEYYLNYGKALLRLSQSANDVFGDSIRNKQQEYDDKNEENKDDKDNNEIKESGEDKEDVQKNNNKNSEIENQNNDNDNNNNNNNNNSTSIDEENKENENAEENDDIDENDVEENENNYDPAEDREFAWEALETARIIVEKFLQERNPTESDKDLNEESKKYMPILAEIHCLLAESQMEEENFPGALDDYQKALALRRVCNDSWRELAYIHFMSSLCATYCGQNDISKQHLKDSAQLVQNRSVELLKSLNIINNENDINKQKTENENDFNIVSENEQLLLHLDAALKMENISNEKREELEDLKQNLKDLLDKLNEKNEEQETMNESEKGLLNEMIQTILNKSNNLNDQTIEEGDEDEYEDENEDGMEEDQGSDYEDNDVDNKENENEDDNDNDVDNNNKNVTNPNTDNEKQNEFKKYVPHGITTIGFNASTTENEDQQTIHNLGSFGKGNSKKRSIEEAEIDETNPQAKKMRLSNANDQSN